MTTETLNQAAIDNLDALELLELGFDDIPDAPGFVTPATGIYLVDMKLKTGTYERPVKDSDEKVEDIKISANFVIKQLVELNEEHAGKLEDGEEAPKGGDRFNMNYFGRQGIQSMVTELRLVGKAMGATGPADLVAQLEDASAPVLLTVQRRKNRWTDKQTGEQKENWKAAIKEATLHIPE